MSPRYKFNRLEFAGSLGDLGTLLPLAIAMIMINGLSPSGLFFAVGLFYTFSGLYYGITVPVQPMKVIGAYAIAMGLSASQIVASGALIGLFLLIIGGTGAITLIGKYTPKSVVRGVQLSTGTLLITQGVKFMVGSSKFQILRQAAEPYLSLQTLGPVPIGMVIGIIGGILTLLLLDNKRLPAGLIVVSGGLVLGLIFGAHEGFDKFRLGLYIPKVLPYGRPTNIDFAFALLLLVLPQIPITIGNAVIANADLSREYFGKDSERVSATEPEVWRPITGSGLVQQAPIS
jgi:SulP family sulfate permease